VAVERPQVGERISTVSLAAPFPWSCHQMVENSIVQLASAWSSWRRYLKLDISKFRDFSEKNDFLFGFPTWFYVDLMWFSACEITFEKCYTPFRKQLPNEQDIMMNFDDVFECQLDAHSFHIHCSPVGPSVLPSWSTLACTYYVYVWFISKTSKIIFQKSANVAKMT